MGIKTRDRKETKIKGESVKKVKEENVNERELSILAQKLLKNLEKNRRNDLVDKAKRVLEYPGVKEVLGLLAVGSFLVLAVAVPSLPVIAKEILDERSDREWRKYNPWYLQRTLKRLKKQKLVDFDLEDDKIVVKLTGQGKKKILKYSLASLEIKRPIVWDRKWRLIIYDVPNEKRKSADLFSQTLRDLGMYRMQKSVFLCPFPCENEVEFLREFYGIGEHVWILMVSNFENDKIFREYFDI